MHTPLTLGDIVLGEVIWAASKSVLSGAAIMLVAGVLGYASFPSMLIALPVIVLTGLAFASLAMIVTAIAPSYDFFMFYQTLALTPMMLLSGVFFPITQLPAAAQKITLLLPLAHAVALIRPAMPIAILAGPAFLGAATGTPHLDHGWRLHRVGGRYSLSGGSNHGLGRNFFPRRRRGRILMDGGRRILLNRSSFRLRQRRERNVGKQRHRRSRAVDVGLRYVSSRHVLGGGGGRGGGVNYIRCSERTLRTGRIKCGRRISRDRRISLRCVNSGSFGCSGHRRRRGTQLHAIAERAQDRGKILTGRSGQRRHRLRDDKSATIECAGGLLTGHPFAPRQRRTDQIGEPLQDIDTYGALTALAIAERPIGVAIELLIDRKRGAAAAGQMLRARQRREINIVLLLRPQQRRQ